MVPLTTFCGCMSLRTGCSLIGVFGLLFSIIMIVRCPSFVYIYDIACSGALVLGIQVNNRRYFWLWMVWHSIQTTAMTMVLSTCVLSTAMVLQLADMFDLPAKAMLKLNVAMSLATPMLSGAIMVNAYFLWVVYSHFIEMREQQMRHRAPIPSAPIPSV